MPQNWNPPEQIVFHFFNTVNSGGVLSSASRAWQRSLKKLDLRWSDLHADPKDSVMKTALLLLSRQSHNFSMTAIWIQVILVQRLLQPPPFPWESAAQPDWMENHKHEGALRVQGKAFPAAQHWHSTVCCHRLAFCSTLSRQILIFGLFLHKSAVQYEALYRDAAPSDTSSYALLFFPCQHCIWYYEKNKLLLNDNKVEKDFYHYGLFRNFLEIQKSNQWSSCSN